MNSNAELFKYCAVCKKKSPPTAYHCKDGCNKCFSTENKHCVNCNKCNIVDVNKHCTVCKKCFYYKYKK